MIPNNKQDNNVWQNLSNVFTDVNTTLQNINDISDVEVETNVTHELTPQTIILIIIAAIIIMFTNKKL